MNEDFPCFDRLDGQDRVERRHQNGVKAFQVKTFSPFRGKQHLVVLFCEEKIRLKTLR